MTDLDKHYPTWEPEFRAVLADRIPEHSPEKIRLAEYAIFDRIDGMGTRPISIDDVDERCAMSYALSLLRSFQVDGGA